MLNKYVMLLKDNIHNLPYPMIPSHFCILDINNYNLFGYSETFWLQRMFLKFLLITII